MLKIILCDDDPFILKIIQEQIEGILSSQGLDGRIVCISSNGKDMISYLKNHPEEYLFFLDLDFGNNEFNGIDLAKQIRSIVPGSKIVFVTNHYELALDVLKSGTEPFGFIEKTTNIHKMNRNCYQYLYLANKQMNVSLGDGFVRSHRSVIVQKCHMIGMEDGMIRLVNGAFAPCSFRLRNEMKGIIYGNKKQ